MSVETLNGLLAALMALFMASVFILWGIVLYVLMFADLNKIVCWLQEFYKEHHRYKLAKLELKQQKKLTSKTRKVVDHSIKNMLQCYDCCYKHPASKLSRFTAGFIFIGD